MIKKILFLFSLCIPTLIFGQNQLQPLLNMPTPQAASIGRFGQIPVDYSTGMPNIDIPLYSIKLDNIELPISCKYHLASVKPDAGFGIMTLGWSLNSGGCITRNVNCLPDELIDYRGKEAQNSLDGYFKHAQKVVSITSQEKFGEQLYYSGGSTNPSYELSADEFSFNFCGYSGNFYYGSDNKWHVRSDQRIIVEFDPSSGFATNQTLEDSARIDMSRWKKKKQYSRYFNKFKIITPDGTEYYFGGVNATEYSIDYYTRNNSYLIPTSWYLTKIVTTKGHEINLKYRVGKPNCKLSYSPSKVQASDVITFIDNTVGDACNSGFLLFPVYLDTINTPNEKITYDYMKYGSLKHRYLDRQLYIEENFLLPKSMYRRIWGDVYQEDYLCFLNPSRTLDEDATGAEKVRSGIEWELLKSVKIESKIDTYLGTRMISRDPLELKDYWVTHGYHYDFEYNKNFTPKLRSITRRPNAKYPDINADVTDASSSEPQSGGNNFTFLDPNIGIANYAPVQQSLPVDALASDADTSTHNNELSDGDQLGDTPTSDTPVSGDEPNDDNPRVAPPIRPPVAWTDTISSNYVYTFGYHRLPDYLQDDGEPVRCYHKEVRMNFTDYWGYWNSHRTRDYGAHEFFYNRDSDLTCAKAGTLGSISYPTGGSSTFEYELHDFEYGVAPDRQSLEEPYMGSLGANEIDKSSIHRGAGLRVKSITTHNNDLTTIKTFEYRTKDHKSSGILNTMPSTASIYWIGFEKMYRESLHGFSVPTTNQNSALVNYTRVKVNTHIDGVYNGSEIYSYTSYTDSIDGKSLFDEPANRSWPYPYNDYAPVATSSKASARFKLKKKEIYSASNNLLQTDEYEYTASSGDEEDSDKNYILSVSHANLVYPTSYTIIVGDVNFYTSMECKGFLYRTYLKSYFPCKKTTKTYVQNSNNTIDTQTTYTYNQDKQLRSESLWGPKNTLLQTTDYMYPNDITLKYLQLGGNNKRYDAYVALDQLNIVTAPIAQTVKKGDKVVSCNVALYDLVDGFPVKTEDYTLKEKVDSVGFQPIHFINNKENPVNDKLKKAYSYAEFDKYHNPCYVWSKQRKLALVWGRTGQILAGKIENVDLHDLKNTPDFKLGEEYMYLHFLRDKFPHAHITDYQVNPFLGLTSSADIRGVLSAFRYDTLGRLIFSGTSYEDIWHINNVFDYNYE